MGVAAVETIARWQISRTKDEGNPDGPDYPFPGIAYTWVLDGDGVLYRCWGLEVRTWHNGAVVDGVARNASHVGAAYIGLAEPNLAQIAGLARAWRLSEGELDWGLDLEGHKDHYATSCPSDWPAWRPQLQAAS